MRAAWYERTGTAQDVLRCGEMEILEVGLGEVRVRVHVSGVNLSDVKRRSGWQCLKMPIKPPQQILLPAWQPEFYAI